MRECTEEGERSRDASESGQLVLLFCVLFHVTYIVIGVCGVQVRISMAALMNLSHLDPDVIKYVVME